MSATLRASRAKHQGSGAGNLTSTITLGNPTGLVDGDLMTAILVISFGTSALALNSAPAGWTQMFASGPISNGGGGFGYFWVYRKIASSEPANRSWTFNNSVAFYNCQNVALVGVNTATPYEQLSSATSAGAATGATISRAADTTGISETICSIVMANNGSGTSPSVAESSGTEQFEELFGSCDIALNLLDAPTSGHYAITGTFTVGSGGTAALAMTQFALNPVAVDANVTAPPAVANASAPTPTVGPGIGAPAARATAIANVPPVISGAQNIQAVPAIATASRGPVRVSSSRIELLLPPDVGGEIELVEDP